MNGNGEFNTPDGILMENALVIATTDDTFVYINNDSAPIIKLNKENTFLLTARSIFLLMHPKIFTHYISQLRKTLMFIKFLQAVLIDLYLRAE